MIPTLHQDSAYRRSSLPIQELIDQTSNFVKQTGLLRAKTFKIDVNIITVYIRLADLFNEKIFYI